MSGPLGRRACGRELEQYLLFSGWDMVEPVPCADADGAYKVEVMGAREKIRLARTAIPNAVYRVPEFKARFFPESEIDLQLP